jgi:hypothetical protein
MQRFLHDLEASKELTDARNAAREAWRDYKRKEKEDKRAIEYMQSRSYR